MNLHFSNISHCLVALIDYIEAKEKFVLPNSLAEFNVSLLT